MSEKLHLTGMSGDELAAFAESAGEPAYRGNQIRTALRKHRLREFSDISDLPKRFRAQLSELATPSVLKINSRFESVDGTRRYLMVTAEGHPVEAVYIPTGRRDTICFSSQSGCPLKCEFCLTARLGLLKNLSAGEIVEQIILVLNDVYGERNETPYRTNLVAMGAGEPLLNLASLKKAVEILAEEDGLFIVPRRITVSTAGIVPKIREFAKLQMRPNLAISLSSPNDELRDKLMPVNKRWRIAELMDAAREFERTRGRAESLTFEYVLLEKVNDSQALAGDLARLMIGNKLQKVKVNLIPHNPAEPLPFRPPKPERVAAFQAVLVSKGISAYVRTPRGRDIFAACGQLAAKDGSALVNIGV